MVNNDYNIKLEGAWRILGGHMTLSSGHARPFSKILGVVSRLSLGKCTTNLKYASLIILQQLAFNGQKFGGHVTYYAQFSTKILRGHVQTVPGNMLVQFEVYIAL